MKICPKCAQSFADGFKYCPRDATELVKYDLRTRIHTRDDFQFLLKNESLVKRLRREVAEAIDQLKRHPSRYLITLLQGEGTNYRRRRLLQAGMATAVIFYTSILLAVLLVGLFNSPFSSEEAVAAPTSEPPNDYVRIVIPTSKELAEESNTSNRGLLGGSLPQIRRARGGGGGNDGARSRRGGPPDASLNPQVARPNLDPPRIPNPTLIIRPTVYADPSTLKHFAGPIGEVTGAIDAPSRGPGKGTGIGPGNGPGYGPGEDGNTGGNKMRMGGGPTNGTSDTILTATGDLRPTIIYKEKAKYTEEARQNRVQGSVVLSAVFGADGRLSDIRTVHGLPNGLTEAAIEAAQHIRFRPAMRQGRPVSVRFNLEFNFALY